VTLIFDLQNLIGLSVGTSDYSLSVLSKLFKPFLRYRGISGKDIWLDERTNKQTNGQTV